MNPLLPVFLLCVTVVFFALPGTANAQTPASQLQEELDGLKTFAAQSYLEDLQRADLLTFRLVQAASPYCADNRKYSFGATPRRLADMPAHLQPALSNLFEPRPDLHRFLSIPRGSPLWESGRVTVEDRLVELTERNSTAPIKPAWGLDRASSMEAVNDELTLKVLRKGSTIELAVRPHMLCNLPLDLNTQSRLVASASRTRIELSTGLLRYVQSDDELALLLATRLARSILPAGGTGNTPEVERRADYLAAYLVVHAGYDLRKALRIWQHIGANSDAPELASLMPEHRVTAERLLHLRQTLAEIDQKHASGLAVRPVAQWLSVGSSQGSTPPLHTPIPEAARLPSSEEQALQDISRIPFLRSGGIVGYQRFLKSPMRPRAFALAQTGAWSFRSGASASADALAHCEVLSKGIPCYLYAVDDRVVWNTATAAQAPQPATNETRLQNLRPPAPSGYARIDDLSAVPLPSKDMTVYKAFLEKPIPRAFIVTEDGNGRYWIGPGALEYALTWCERLNAACWLYAFDDTVVWHPDPAKRISSRKQLEAGTNESQFFDAK